MQLATAPNFRHWRALAALIALAIACTGIALPAVGADPGASAASARVPGAGRWRGPRNCAHRGHQGSGAASGSGRLHRRHSIGALIGAALRDRNERGRNGVDRVGAFDRSAVRGSASAFRSADSHQDRRNSATSSGPELDCGMGSCWCKKAWWPASRWNHGAKHDPFVRT